MTTKDDLQAALATFHKHYPRPGVPDLLSRLKFVEFNYERDWSRLWSENGVLHLHANDPCVYFFFAGNGDLLYVGSTRALGNRFSQHFDVKDAKWKDRTKSLAILPIPKENWFEVRAIEGYLIQQLAPPENYIGNC
jgi:hypothetical protein